MISIITIDEKDKWDDIVKSFNNYDVNYLHGYSKAFQIHGDGKPFLFYFDDGSTRAMNVVMKRDIADDKHFKGKIPSNTLFDLSTPYGYGGIWIEGNGYETVHQAYDKYCKDKGYVSEFVRFHLLSDSYLYYRGVSETNTRNIVRSLELPLEEILMDFEHKVRKNIKKASKADLKVEIDNDGIRLDDFLEIYYQTMNRTNADQNFFFSREFFNEINKMIGNYVYIYILYEGKVISTELILYANDSCYSFLGGTNRDYYHLRPNDLLKYEIIKWAKEKGLKRFILGGGYGQDDGIYRYKRSLAPNGIYDYYVGKRIFDEKTYQKLVEMRRESEFNIENKFFPKYRG